MAALPNTLTLSADDYFDQGLDAEYEYIEGVLVPRRIGNPQHSRMVIILGAWLVEYSPLIDVFAGLVLNTASGRFRVPDVCCYSKAGPQPDPVAAPSNPPVAVFEVLSPSDSLDEIIDKFGEYAALGVEHKYVVDPKHRRVLSPDFKGSLLAVDALSIVVGSASIDINTADLFRKLN
jgi:Uma2 family endonuclease